MLYRWDHFAASSARSAGTRNRICERFSLSAAEPPSIEDCRNSVDPWIMEYAKARNVVKELDLSRIKHQDRVRFPSKRARECDSRRREGQQFDFSDPTAYRTNAPN